ncbi:polysaccharide export periplasmic protein, partial [Vibrio ichthyoenteri ATCC 700023]
MRRINALLLALCLFAGNLLADNSVTDSSVANGSVANGSVAESHVETVQIGDMIQINLPGEESLNRGFQVDKRGRIDLPEVGTLYVAGYSEKQLSESVLTALNEVYRDVTSASVYISQQQILISVQGYVISPGEYTLPKNANVQMALHAAGGLRSGAQLDNMLLKRGNGKQSFNYKAFLDSGDESLLPSLKSLDSLFVPASPLVGNIEQQFDAAKQANAGDSGDSRTAIKVFGEVNSPGSFSFKPSTDLVDILMRAGGVTRYASVEQIRVITNNTPQLFNLKRYLDSGDRSLLPNLSEGTTIFVAQARRRNQSRSQCCLH